MRELDIAKERDQIEADPKLSEEQRDLCITCLDQIEELKNLDAEYEALCEEGHDGAVDGTDGAGEGCDR